MVFVLKLFAVIMSSSLVQSTETTKVSKSVKLNEKMIYDCVDIYKQPSLNHPLLQNHKIQMKPSFAVRKSKNDVESIKYEKIIECPNGSVPILRNTKEYLANAQYFAKKHFNPLIAESHGSHFAGVRLHDGAGPYHGVGSWISVHDLNISRDQISYAQIYVAGGKNKNEFEVIQAGWMINPILFGDGRPWGYGIWKGANGTDCFNTACLGFIQVSEWDLLHKPLPPGPPISRNIALSIQQDIETGNWWVTDLMRNKPDISIGYWPKELFNLISFGVDMVGVGGAVESSPSGKSPPMGNGYLPTNDDMHAARVADIVIINSKWKIRKADKWMVLIDSEKCYGVKKGKKKLFTFGGPGGDSCGI